MHQRHTYKIMSIVTIMLSSILGNFFVSSHVSALTYQSTVSPEFTINEALTITLSSSDIHIDELAVGQSDISNIVDITVLTNNSYGYTLTSTAGNGDTFTNTNLINADDNTKIFTSLAPTDSISDPASFADSKWGYSFSTDSKTTWSNYSGLPYYGNTGATLLAKDTKSASTGDVVNFRIAAKSSATQNAGIYNNVINFSVTGNTRPNDIFDITTMQEMTSSICADTTTPSSSATTFDTAPKHRGDPNYVPRTTLTDTRDGSTYLISKLADGHCWMSQNLALELDAESSVTAYDFSTGTTFAYTPANTTQTTTGTPWAQDASDGARSYSGDKDKYIGGTDINVSGGTGSDIGEPYEKIGIRYNWAAATAQTGAEAAAAGSSGATEVKTSICPKGWRLPASSGDYSFTTLMGSYSLPTTNQSQGYSGQLQNPLNFNRPGYYHWSSGALDNRGTFGNFWSSVGYSSTNARSLGFYSSYFRPQSGNTKGYGFSVRCVAV